MPTEASEQHRRAPSIRGSLSFAMTLMGGLAIGLSLLTGFVYRQMILEDQRAYVGELLSVEVPPLLDELTARAVEMGISVHQDEEFHAAMEAPTVDAMHTLLDEQFHQYYITAGVVPTVGLALTHADLSPWITAHESLIDPFSVCSQTRVRWSQRDKVERLKTTSALCFHDGRPLWLVAQPFGGLRPRTYLLNLIDPVQALMKVEQRLELPVTLMAEGRLIARSEHWPESGESRWLKAEHRLVGEGGVLTLTVAKDINVLLTRLAWIQWFLVLGTVAVILVLTQLLWRRIRRLVLDPINALGEGLACLSQMDPKDYRPLPFTGGREVRCLTEAFNQTGRELRDLYLTLERMAYTDTLTRLPNRSRFNEMLELHVSLNQHRVAPFALFIMDLDRFKWVNDNLGHLAGDQLLAQVADRLASVLRKTDVVERLQGGDPVARLGGDEFAALIPGVGSEEEAVLVAGKIAAAMAQPFSLEGREVEVGISIGIALCPRHGRDPQQLMRLADVAMYQAKKGGDVFQIYDEARDHSRLYRASLEGALREALIHFDGMWLEYQPQVNVASGRVVGVEALVRWRGMEDGPVTPDVFVPLAEQCGLIDRLTRWVLNHALDQAAAWHGEGKALRVSVNLSTRNLAEPDLAQAVECALVEHGLSAEHLTLEITETYLLSDPDQALVQLKRLAAMGVRLSLDDFGTGYSSLTCLQRLPLHEIKIDRRFVRHMHASPDDRVIVEAVVGLARGLGKEVLAEGVEDLATLEALRAMGCRLVQGYYIAPPMPADQFADWFACWSSKSSGRASS